MKKLIVWTTNSYPKYHKTTETFPDLASAEKRMEELSKELMQKCQTGELQDYQLEICKG